jgi:ABC-2 type transport system permease protein
MSKTGLVIKREYLTRVKKRSFIIMTFLGPLLMASVWIVPFILMTQSEGTKVIEVLDETGIFIDQFQDTDEIHFVYIFEDIRSARENLIADENFGILHIAKMEYAIPREATLYSNGNPGLSMKSYIQSSMNKIIENKKLLDVYGIDSEELASVKGNMKLEVRDLETDEESFTEASWALGFVGGFLIYMFIFMYGSQVMRGVIEEKTSRIVEVIVSSVKPVQLMAGKIIGIALVGLTQFLLWIILTLTIIGIFSVAYAPSLEEMGTSSTLSSPGQLFPAETVTGELDETSINLEDSEQLAVFMDIFSSINFGVIIVAFLFYFIGGYLLYGSLFAAIGSAVDSEADTQQFMFPVTIPLILSIIVGLSFVLNNPDGQVAWWFSVIPLTSPIVMMIRIPFGVNIYTDLLPSALLLVAGFMLTTWIAAKIYRTGILMYGKKVSYKELWKWVRYR